MKFKKKTAMLVSFTVGTLLLATTALADIASKSGYDQLKDSIKMTAEQTTDKYDSFTLDFSMAVKDNGKTLMSQNETIKHDRKMGASENISSGIDFDGEKRSNQIYSDKSTIIRLNASDPTYYVTEFTKERTDNSFDKDPFKEDEAADVEKIVDAVVGSLKDHVVVTENPDGSKALTGSLTEVQIPSLVNAVASFQLKQEFNGNNYNNRKSLPHLTKDIFVKEVTGSAKVNPDGVMESILGSAVLSGKDDQGEAHDITVEALFTLSDVNSTKVTKPDLTGKNVIKDIARYADSEMSNPEKFIGKFKNEIIIEKDGKFVKVGERYLDITQIDSKSAAGRYYTEFKPGFEEYAASTSKFEFSAQFEKDQAGNASFEGTTPSGEKVRGNIYINGYEGRVNLNIDNLNSSLGNGMMFDSTFIPDID